MSTIKNNEKNVKYDCKNDEVKNLVEQPEASGTKRRHNESPVEERSSGKKRLRKDSPYPVAVQVQSSEEEDDEGLTNRCAAKFKSVLENYIKMLSLDCEICCEKGMTGHLSGLNSYDEMMMSSFIYELKKYYNFPKVLGIVFLFDSKIDDLVEFYIKKCISPNRRSYATPPLSSSTECHNYGMGLTALQFQNRTPPSSSSSDTRNRFDTRNTTVTDIDIEEWHAVTEDADTSTDADDWDTRTDTDDGDTDTDIEGWDADIEDCGTDSEDLNSTHSSNCSHSPEVFDGTTNEMDVTYTDDVGADCEDFEVPSPSNSSFSPNLFDIYNTIGSDGADESSGLNELTTDNEDVDIYDQN